MNKLEENEIARVSGGVLPLVAIGGALAKASGVVGGASVIVGGAYSFGRWMVSK